MPNLLVTDATALAWQQLAIAAALTLGLTTGVAVVIRRPLHGVLQMICGNEVGARFWTTFASVLLVLGPLFLVFTAAGSSPNMAELVRRTVYLGSFGVIGAFLVMGGAVMLSAPSQAMTKRRAAELGTERSAPFVAE